MKSPFAGMDPYIEAAGLWLPFHSRLISRIIDALEETVPVKYSVRPGERNFVDLVDPEGKTSSQFYPDAGVVGPRDRSASATATSPPVAATEIATEAVSLRPVIGERIREEFIEITVEDPDLRLVTCIEVLSPTNKRKGSDGWKEYLRKRQGLLLGEANLIEIDLLRGGTRMPMLDPWPNSPYTLLVARAGSPTCRVWPAYCTRPLPVIPVPLDDPDPDLTLDLQPMIASIYERSRYSRDIDYTKPLAPPLADPDQTWLMEQLRAQASPS